jgi:hypothetical protein
VLEHHVVVVVKSTEKYLHVMSKLLSVASERFGAGCECHGYDPKKIEKQLAEITEERNLAVAECHRMRCEAEAARVTKPKKRRKS